jgi:hypothetical protein
LHIAAAGPETQSGLEFGVTDLKATAAALAALGLAVKSTPTMVMVSDPDGVLISFVQGTAK